MQNKPQKLLDQITLMHGPQDLLSRFFMVADDTGRESGLRFRLRSDFDGLVEINRENRESWSPLSPIFDPAHSNLRIDAAFWLEGIDERGETVVTHAARLFDCDRTSLLDEIESLGGVCEASVAPDAVRDAPSAVPITGRTMFAGGVWVRPEWRRFGLTKIISRICSAYAHTRWNTASSSGFVETRLHALGLSRAYGPYTVIDGLSFRLAWRPDVRMLLLWMGAGTMLADLAQFADRGIGNSAGERYAHDKTLVAGSAPRQG